MTDRLPVHALDPAGASDGQGPVYDAATGRVVWADGSSTGGVQTIVAGTGVTVDSTDPANPVVSATGSTDPEIVRDTMAAALVAGSNITITTDDAANTITIAAAGGGSSSAWTAAVNDAMSSLAAFTSVSGTWAINAGVTRQSNTGTGTKLRYSTKLPLNDFVAEVECNMISGSGDQRMGIMLGGNAAGGGAVPVVYIVNDGSWHYVFDRFGTARDFDVTGGTGSYGTWRKIRVAASGTRRSMWIDGTLVGVVEQTIVNGEADYLHLTTSAAVVDFRNFKVWTPTLPA